MKALVVGYGSIGRRHAEILTELGVEVGVVSSREIQYPVAYMNLSQAIEEMRPSYIVVANKTSDHYNVLIELIDCQWEGIVLVEKPLFAESRLLPEGHRLRIAVAYNLRFHPLLRKLKSELQNERIMSISIYAGQFLPDWRPQRDYRLSYSSSREEGGGVLRDLSHELDYMLLLCGQWLQVSALGGRFSSLEVTGEDMCSVLAALERCPIATLQVNYLDRPGRREIVVVTDRHTYRVDMRNGLFEIDGQVEVLQTARNDTYLAQHQAILQDQWSDLCTLSDGLAVVQLIEAIEKSFTAKEWVRRE
ncbi:Gfo/Idh/MocA family protein [Cohnella cellulosilytica]|uniref:Gfo/Idh/MocA family protein n=1 Tax=Cohnella cellulosilytica TaxID=986710 RepID=A0ABW2FR92_9BACL